MATYNIGQNTHKNPMYKFLIKSVKIVTVNIYTVLLLYQNTSLTGINEEEKNYHSTVNHQWCYSLW